MNKQQKDKKMKNKQPTATFCITGALEKYKRVDAIVEIHNKTNARFVSGVSSRTDYLISSRKDTSKAKKAKGVLGGIAKGLYYGGKVAKKM